MWLGKAQQFSVGDNKCHTEPYHSLSPPLMTEVPGGSRDIPRFIFPDSLTSVHDLFEVDDTSPT